jgi:hypothetical protein
MPTQAAEIMTLQARVKELVVQLDVVEDTLHTLIVWIVASAVSPLSPREGKELIEMLERSEVKK